MLGREKLASSNARSNAVKDEDKRAGPTGDAGSTSGTKTDAPGQADKKSTKNDHDVRGVFPSSAPGKKGAGNALTTGDAEGRAVPSTKPKAAPHSATLATASNKPDAVAGGSTCAKNSSKKQDGLERGAPSGAEATTVGTTSTVGTNPFHVASNNPFEVESRNPFDTTISNWDLPGSPSTGDVDKTDVDKTDVVKGSVDTSKESEDNQAPAATTTEVDIKDDTTSKGSTGPNASIEKAATDMKDGTSHCATGAPLTTAKSTAPAGTTSDGTGRAHVPKAPVVAPPPPPPMDCGAPPAMTGFDFHLQRAAVPQQHVLHPFHDNKASMARGIPLAAMSQRNTCSMFVQNHNDNSAMLMNTGPAAGPGAPNMPLGASNMPLGGAGPLNPLQPLQQHGNINFYNTNASPILPPGPAYWPQKGAPPANTGGWHQQSVSNVSTYNYQGSTYQSAKNHNRNNTNDYSQSVRGSDRAGGQGLPFIGGAPPQAPGAENNSLTRKNAAIHSNMNDPTKTSKNVSHADYILWKHGYTSHSKHDQKLLYEETTKKDYEETTKKDYEETTKKDDGINNYDPPRRQYDTARTKDNNNNNKSYNNLARFKHQYADKHLQYDNITKKKEQDQGYLSRPKDDYRSRPKEDRFTRRSRSRSKRRMSKRRSRERNADRYSSNADRYNKRDEEAIAEELVAGTAEDVEELLGSNITTSTRRNTIINLVVTTTTRRNTIGREAFPHLLLHGVGV
ncbi:unnamed protein product [Amoebophrya sp. A25]|nr:unnamed protein product [Amoebophrya sp. A25]|eukprot:GSA25T00027725001.1